MAGVEKIKKCGSLQVQPMSKVWEIMTTFQYRPGCDEPLLLALDLLGQRIALADGFGSLKHATRQFTAALAGADNRDAIAAALRESAQAACGLANLQAHARMAAQSTERVVSTAHRQYRLTCAFVGTRQFSWGTTVLVHLDIDQADPLEEGQLMRAFRLTRAQARVARLLVQGMRNAEIAQRLFLSIHTVRHHVEQIRTKAGGHTRAATALRLRAGGLQTVQPTHTSTSTL